MPISVSCACGKTLSVKDDLAGKRGKCPACGTMLAIPQPVKPVSKPVEEEWSLVPLEDDPKPVKAAPKPAAGNTAKPPVKGPIPTPVKSTPAKPTAFADDEFSLAPLDDDLLGKAAAASKPAPAAKPPVTAAPSPAKGTQPTSTTAAPTAAPAKKIPLGGPAPAPLDLPPLDDDLFASPAAAASKQVGSAKPPVSAAKTTSASAATKSLGGAAPAPLDLAPLEGGEEHNHASWIDEGAETQFKVADTPVSSAAGTPSAPTLSMKPDLREEREGEVSCPHCGDPLKRTLTVWNLPYRLLFGRMIVAFFGTPAAFKCKRCGLVHYEELHSASRRAAGTGVQHLFMTIGLAALLIMTIGGLGFGLLQYNNNASFRDSRERMENERLEREKRMDEMMGKGRERPSSLPPWQPNVQSNPTSKQQAEEMRKRSEKLRRESEEWNKKYRELRTQPATPRPNPAPPMTTPMKPASPFEETTVPPATPPTKPAPVNPFQPID